MEINRTAKFQSCRPNTPEMRRLKDSENETVDYGVHCKPDGTCTHMSQISRFLSVCQWVCNWPAILKSFSNDAFGKQNLTAFNIC